MNVVSEQIAAMAFLGFVVTNFGRVGFCGKEVEVIDTSEQCQSHYMGK